MAKALKTNQSLQWLNLYSNNIGREGTVAIAKALEKIQSLQGLNLSSNNIGPEGAAAIAKALETNQKLLWLDLPNNYNIGREQAINEALQRNRAFHVVRQWKD